MKNKSIFTGAATAIITPFSEGKIDYIHLGNIIEHQISRGIDALVVCGTTGESPTLTDEEQRKCISYTAEKVSGRIPVIAGAGSNHTDYAVELSKYACDAGADALLVITPYYNKATPKGLIKHYTAIADAVTKPIIMYNVPSRTGVDIPVDVCEILSKHEMIAGIKEASGDIARVCRIISRCGDNLDVYSGNDDMTVPVMSVGGKGVISVLGNIMPDKVHRMCNLCLNGDYSESGKMQISMQDINDALFCEVNPIPVKQAMKWMGFCSGELRLPMCEADSSTKNKLYEAMKKSGIPVDGNLV